MKNKKKYTLTAKIKPYWQQLFHSEEECDCHECFRETRETIDAENIFDAQRQFKNIAEEIRLNDDGRDCYINNCKIDFRISAYKFQTGLFDDKDFKLSKLFEDLIDDINSYYSDVIERDPQMISLIIANGARKILRHIALKTTYSNKVKTDAMIEVRELAELILKDFCPDVNPDARLYNTNYSFSLYIFKTYRQMLEEMRYYKELNATMPHDIEPNNFLDFQESILVRDYLETKDSN